MYILLLITFTAIFISAYIITRLHFNNRLSALPILISTMLYLFPTIAGALGILRPYPLITFALVTLLISVITLIFYKKGLDKPNKLNYISIEYLARPVSIEVILVVVPTILSILWISFFVVQSVKHKVAHYYIPPLPWDVVEYHFPHLVNAIQSGSLWTTIWAHYPMGCEMFHSWGFIFLRSDTLVYATHFYFSMILLFFSCAVLHILCFPGRKALSGTDIIAYLLLTVMLLISPPLWDMHFNQ